MGAMASNMGAMASNMVNASCLKRKTTHLPDGAPFFGGFHWIVLQSIFCLGGGFDYEKGVPFMEI